MGSMGTNDFRIVPANANHSSVTPDGSGKNLHEGRLSGAILTDQRLDFARPDIESYILQSLNTPEFLRDAEHLDAETCGALPCLRGRLARNLGGRLTCEATNPLTLLILCRIPVVKTCHVSVLKSPWLFGRPRARRSWRPLRPRERGSAPRGRPLPKTLRWDRCTYRRYLW
jgi:hypothetical protein